MLRKTVFAVLLAAVMGGSLYAGTGSAGWYIFRRPQSTKPRSVTSVASVRGDLSGVFYNPSILGTIRQKEVFFMSETGMANDTFGGMLYGHPLSGGTAGLAGGVVYYDAGKETLSWMDSSGIHEATLSMQRDMLGMLSYGRMLGKSLSVGATLKFATSNIAERKSATAFCVDAGAMYSLPQAEGVVVSVAAQNIGSASKFITASNDLPMSIWAGVSYGKAINDNSRWGAGLDLPYIVSEGRTVPTLGFEYALGKVSVNAGYKLGSVDSALQVGFGVLTDRYDIGLAIAPSSHLSSTMKLSVGYRW